MYGVCAKFKEVAVHLSTYDTRNKYNFIPV